MVGTTRCSVAPGDATKRAQDDEDAQAKAEEDQADREAAAQERQYRKELERQKRQMNLELQKAKQGSRAGQAAGADRCSKGVDSRKAEWDVSPTDRTADVRGVRNRRWTTCSDDSRHHEQRRPLDRESGAHL